MNRFFLVVLFVAGCARAAEDPALEERVTHIASELRCLVCQNQTIADSNADLALDLRNTIREQLKGGASEKEVVGFMVARYGDFVLYNPPFKATTVLLWLGPFLLVVLGAYVLVRRLRRGRPKVAELSEDERARAERLLNE